MSTKKKSVLREAVDSITKVAEQLEEVNTALWLIGTELSAMNERMEATNATLDKIVEEQKATSRLATEQLKVLGLSLPKEG